MTEFDEIIQALKAFRDERDWEQFHDSKNLSLALSIEVAELNELYLWKNSQEAIDQVSKKRLAEELADVFAYAFMLADKNNLNVKDIIMNKIKKNGEKYPIVKSKGTAQKYTEL